MKLTEKQKRFVDFYIETGNATEAAKKAGYKPKAAYATGAENLRKPQIKKAIEERLAQLESAKIADMTEVLQFVTAAMRGELEEDVVVVQGAGNGVSVAGIIKKQISARDRMEAAKALMKRYPAKPDAEEQQLRIDKLRAEVQNMQDTDNEGVVIVDDVPED